jgi:hypothetical protein
MLGLGRAIAGLLGLNAVAETYYTARDFGIREPRARTSVFGFGQPLRADPGGVHAKLTYRSGGGGHAYAKRDPKALAYNLGGSNASRRNRAAKAARRGSRVNPSTLIAGLKRNAIATPMHPSTLAAGLTERLIDTAKRYPGLTATTLAGLEGSTRSAVSGILARVVKQGRLARTESAQGWVYAAP